MLAADERLTDLFIELLFSFPSVTLKPFSSDLLVVKDGELKCVGDGDKDYEGRVKQKSDRRRSGMWVGHAGKSAGPELRLCVNLIVIKTG